MNRYAVVVEWAGARSYTVEAENEDDAVDVAIDTAEAEYPDMDDYRITDGPELLPEPTP